MSHPTIQSRNSDQGPFTPISDCSHKFKEDGSCGHPSNITPECHVLACPRIHARIARAFECESDYVYHYSAEVWVRSEERLSDGTFKWHTPLATDEDFNRVREAVALQYEPPVSPKKIHLRSLTLISAPGMVGAE